MKPLSLILPCYNEAKSLPNLVRRAKAAAEEAGLTAAHFQLVLVDNGSSDNTASVLEELKASNLAPWLKVVSLPVNQGYGGGIWTGLCATSAPVVGWSHADEQCDPADSIRALGEVEPRTIVRGVRSGRDWKDRTMSRVFEKLARLLLGLSVDELNGQPKVFHRELLSEIAAPPKSFAFDLYVLYRAARAGYSLKSIPVFFPPRVHGASRWAHSLLGRSKTIFGMVRYMGRLLITEGRV